MFRLFIGYVIVIFVALTFFLCICAGQVEEREL